MEAGERSEHIYDTICVASLLNNPELKYLHILTYSGLKTCWVDDEIKFE